MKYIFHYYYIINNTCKCITSINLINQIYKSYLIFNTQI